MLKSLMLRAATLDDLSTQPPSGKGILTRMITACADCRSDRNRSKCSVVGTSGLLCTANVAVTVVALRFQGASQIGCEFELRNSDLFIAV